MGTRVNITSVEAIAAFRANLIVYQSKARATLEEVSAEITRTRNWVQTTQRTYWDGIARRRARDLEEAKAALFSSRMSNLRTVTAAEQLAVAKAKRALDEAESKLRVLKRWDRDYDNHTGPPLRQMEKLHTVLADDLDKAISYLTKTLATLDAYAGLLAPTATEPNQPPAQTATDGESPSEESATETAAVHKGGVS